MGTQSEYLQQPPSELVCIPDLASNINPPKAMQSTHQTGICKYFSDQAYTVYNYYTLVEKYIVVII